VKGRREVLAVGLVWLVWFGAVLLTVAIGLAAGAYAFAPGWTIHTGLWPLFGWDYNWYYLIAHTGYPDGLGGPQYAFFPLWPQLLRWSGSIPDVVAAGAVAWTASAAAFLAAPASSTPTGSLDSSQTTPARMNTPASAIASDSSAEAATSAAPSRTISCA
jgi:hypothetical protein